MREFGGYAVYEDLLTPSALKALTTEALEAYWHGTEQRLLGQRGGEGRGGHPGRRLVSSGGGGIQDEVYQSPAMLRFLERTCGLPIAATGRRGSYNYYSRRGDFIGLHLDIVRCELVVLTVLQDFSDPRAKTGALRLFPQYIGTPLSAVRRALPDGVVVKMRPGQSVVMFGGLIPHEVLPADSGQSRVVSALCFVAGAATHQREELPSR